MIDRKPTKAPLGNSDSPPIELLTKAEVARTIKRSTRHVQNLVNAGLIPPPIRIGNGRPLWRRADIEKWIVRGCPKPHDGEVLP